MADEITAQSQLDHAVAKRPPGSIFKPFVYASAFNTAVAGIKLDDNGADALFTPVTMLNDEPTTFTFGNDQEYDPHNYKDEYHGEVTATYALAHSLNNATISLAQMVGFNNVASLARSSGNPLGPGNTVGRARDLRRLAA